MSPFMPVLFTATTTSSITQQLLPGEEAALWIDGHVFESVSFLSEGRCYKEHLMQPFGLQRNGSPWKSIELHSLLLQSCPPVSSHRWGIVKHHVRDLSMFPFMTTPPAMVKGEPESSGYNTLAELNLCHKLFHGCERWRKGEMPYCLVSKQNTPCKRHLSQGVFCFCCSVTLPG